MGRVSLAYWWVEQPTVHSTFRWLMCMAGWVNTQLRLKPERLSTTLNKAGKVVRSIFQESLDQSPSRMLQFDFKGTIQKHGLGSRVDDRAWCRSWCDYCWGKMGQKCGLRRRCFDTSGECQWGRLILLCERFTEHLQYCRLFLLAFMRGGAIDHYSNNWHQ